MLSFKLLKIFTVLMNFDVGSFNNNLFFNKFKFSNQRNKKTQNFFFDFSTPRIWIFFIFTFSSQAKQFRRTKKKRIKNKNNKNWKKYKANFLLEPLDRFFSCNTMLGANFRFATAPFGDAESGSWQHYVEIHSVNAWKNSLMIFK